MSLENVWWEAFSSLISIVSLSELCTGENCIPPVIELCIPLFIVLCFPPVLWFFLFFIGLELGQDLDWRVT